MVTSNDLITELRKHIDTPFHHQGRLPGVGLDCVGLLIVSLNSLGIDASRGDEITYGKTPNPRKLKEKLDKYLIADEAPSISNGRVGLFWITKPTHATHIGVIINQDRIIHAYMDADKVVETFNHTWLYRLVGTYKVPGVDY